MMQLEEQALQAFNPGGPSSSAIAAFDGLTIQVGAPLGNSPSLPPSTQTAVQPSAEQAAHAAEQMAVPHHLNGVLEGRSSDAPVSSTLVDQSAQAPGLSQHAHNWDNAADILDDRLSSRPFSQTSRNQIESVDVVSALPPKRPLVPPPSLVASQAPPQRSPPTNVPGQSRPFSTNPRMALASAKDRRAQRWADRAQGTSNAKPSGSRTQLPIDQLKGQVQPDLSEVDAVTTSIFGPLVQPTDRQSIKPPGLSIADKEERHKFVALLKDELERGQSKASRELLSQQLSVDAMEDVQHTSAMDETELGPLGVPDTTKIREEIVEDRDTEGNVIQRRRKVSLEGRPPIPRLPPQYRG